MYFRYADTGLVNTWPWIRHPGFIGLACNRQLHASPRYHIAQWQKFRVFSGYLLSTLGNSSGFACDFQMHKHVLAQVKLVLQNKLN